MGVPALFRWLSKKYPKIVERVVEDKPIKEQGPDGEATITPIDYGAPNPNGFEVDNLYLDMNGIVHPCTHPEGRPAPETEEEMMVEVFKYTERVVNMARPRKVLMMAIDGVAPRAKMNQQRSRRFRAAQEAQDKDDSKAESIQLYEEYGGKLSEEEREKMLKKGWDTNAITPGTPFMDLLAASLRYWVSFKLNTDPGWKNLKIIISDASVPGEGEHKIMDWIRRERSYPEYDANTSHVIYGLDADLIMLALATHEPYFKLETEDVEFVDKKGITQRSVQVSLQMRTPFCENLAILTLAITTGAKKIKLDEHDTKQKPVEEKPFIFLDVSILREYLAVELDLRTSTPFDLERAIDDWVFLIFFVGNDFLPHLPSLEIREGAIDTLLGIWKKEFDRMGGYVTNHGVVDLEKAQYILTGLANSEDEIFRRRKQQEDRQHASSKRRQEDDQARANARNEPKHVRYEQKEPKEEKGKMQLNGMEMVAVTPTSAPAPIHPSLPVKPTQSTAPRLPGSGGGAVELATTKRGITVIGGSAQSVLDNRRANRMAAMNPGVDANLSAAEALKAELAGDGADAMDVASTPADKPSADIPTSSDAPKTAGETDAYVEAEVTEEQDSPRGKKRKAVEQRPVAVEESAETEEDAEGEDDDDEDEDAEGEDDDDIEAPPNPEADQPLPKKAKLKVNPDGTVEYDDTVMLWEPGYRERYYRQKFGVELSDVEFRKGVVKSYLEGLSWVLHYYYQGTPSWQWYYPYHYAPFAADMTDIQQYDIKFNIGAPFQPFEQLMGVFPAASKTHLPVPFHALMTSDESPIIDFYPEDFEIDMNGKKMAWQGVALLPFIEQDRLLSAIASKQDQLTDDERRRNSHGVDVMLIMDENPLYQQFSQLYTKKRPSEPVPIDAKLSFGVFGTVLPDPTCIPGSTLDTPLPNIEECPDLYDNRAISVQYWFPKQLKPHRSVLLPGARPARPVLDDYDKDKVRGSGGSRRRGGFNGGPGVGGGHQSYNSNHNSPGMGTPNSYGNQNSPYSTPSYSPAPSRGGRGGRGRGDFGTPTRGNSNGYQGGGSRGGYGQQQSYGQPPAYGQQPAYAQQPAYGQPPAYGQQQAYGGNYQAGLGGSGPYVHNPYAPVNPYGAPSNPYGGGASGGYQPQGGASRGRGGGSSNRGGSYGGYGYGTRGGR
ncbi:hypothetical protein QFC22_001159 [Naganishia vaughanmartiniae]|uniref:Uncharacterized protein n=1 Tax=Naganishia vaughanmartiniae TaxID=1424756 RepID=A0ACC2XK32_9TREE|nr:hypothetical protein QFC22_001159 [Naganishia vaughanmartiniae]